MFEDRVKDLETRIKIIENKLSERSKKTKKSLEKDLKTAKSKPKNLSMELSKITEKTKDSMEKELEKIKAIVEWMEKKLKAKL